MRIKKKEWRNRQIKKTEDRKAGARERGKKDRVKTEARERKK